MEAKETIIKLKPEEELNFASQLLYTNYMSPPGWSFVNHPGGLFHIHYRGISPRNTSL